MSRRLRIPAFAAALGFLLGACGPDRVTGGFDDTENPAIRVALSGADGLPAGAARVNVYARYQNPLRDSLPILSLTAAGDSVLLDDSVLQAAFAGAQAAGTPSPSRDTLEFNLIATGAAGDAFLGGFSLVKRSDAQGKPKWGFIRRAGGYVRYPDTKGVLAIEARLSAPILGQGGSVGERGMELGLKRLFVPGSPYAAALAPDGSFALSRIAAGRYELKAVSQDDKVYAASDTLEAGSPYSASDWTEADVIWVAP